MIMYSYYGNFIMHIAERNRLDGLYGLTGAMLDEALLEYGGRLGNEDIIFEDDAKSTLFILRWS
jgi:hypothetical protein